MSRGMVQWLIAAVGTAAGLLLMTVVLWAVVRFCVVVSGYLPLVGKRHAARGARTPRDAVVHRDQDGPPT